MDNISKVINNNFECPKYTRYELAKLVRDKRKEDKLTIDEMASRFDVDNNFWESIENATRVFNVRIYKIISQYLNLSLDELLSKENNNMESISFRTKENNEEIEFAVKVANKIFDEMIMQEKIGV